MSIAHVVRYGLEDFDRHKQLELPDGRRVETIRRAELCPEMFRLGVPGIKSNMGKMELLDCYAAFVDSTAQELAKGEVFKSGLPQARMRKAVAHIDQRTKRAN
jgi:hypothetical protein